MARTSGKLKGGRLSMKEVATDAPEDTGLIDALSGSLRSFSPFSQNPVIVALGHYLRSVTKARDQGARK